MTILIGVDDSPHSRAAIDFVKRATWPAGTRILVLSACPPVFVRSPEAAAPDVIRSLNEGLERHHRALAEGAASELRAAGFGAEVRTSPNDPRTAVVDAARDERADLVVVGSHGRSGVRKLLLGSVAAHVVAHAPCSVLVVKTKID